MASRASTPSPLSGRHRSAARIIWFTLTLALGGSLLWLALSSPTARRTPFALAIGPQMASQHGLAGDAAQGGPGAYLEAVEALSGLKLELVRAPSIERAVLLLHNEQVDGLAFSLPSTAAMLPTTAAVSPSFYTGATVMVTRPTAAFRALSVMDGMRVGVIGNGEYRAYLAERHPGIDVYPLPSVDEMLEAVDSGGIDAAIGVDAVLAPLARKRFDERLEVHLVSDGPAVEMRVASLPRRAGEIAMAHQTFLSLPLDTRQDILDRWLTALYRSPPTLRAVLAHYRVHITVLGMFLLAFLLAVAQSQRNARSLASRQASAARILTLVNHEVRNGAASVISAIDLLEAETDPAERNRLFQSARSAADALKHTLTNALEFMFRDMPGQADPAFLQNAEGIVSECLSAMRPLARCKGLHLVLRLEGRYVQQAMCDARALHHIASNLISNAAVVGIRINGGRGTRRGGGAQRQRCRPGYPARRPEPHLRAFQCHPHRAAQAWRGHRALAVPAHRPCPRRRCHGLEPARKGLHVRRHASRRVRRGHRQCRDGAIAGPQAGAGLRVGDRRPAGHRQDHGAAAARLGPGNRGG